MIGSPLLHIGLHKTGTTWLQTTLFNDESAGFWLPWDRPLINREIMLRRPLDFDATLVRSVLKAEALEPPSGMSRVAVISNENLSGNPYAGDYNVGIIADRLYAVFPDSRVMLVLREQRSMIRSNYIQYVRAGGAATFRQYLDPPRGLHKAPVPSPRALCYDEMVAYYQELFGSGALLVLPFEMLRSDPTSFVQAIVTHAGGTVPRSLSTERPQAALCPLTTGLKRRLNKVAVRDAINPSPMFDAPRVGLVGERALVAIDRRLSGRVREIGGRRLDRQLDKTLLPDYSESNRRVEALTGLDLRSFGYA